MDSDEAERILRANLDGDVLAEANHLRFVAGHRARAWEKNVVALGLAGGFLEPLESTAIHLVQSGIARLMTLFPTRSFAAKEIEQYNRENAQEYLDIRDFLVLHYKATTRDDSEFWNYCCTLEPPEGLTEKLEMFRSSGRIFRNNNELFTETNWLAVMVGQGVQAGGYHPLAALLDDEETIRRLTHIRDVVKDTVSQMPTQDEFLAQNGAAIAPEMRMSS